MQILKTDPHGYLYENTLFDIVFESEKIERKKLNKLEKEFNQLQSEKNLEKFKQTTSLTK